MELSGEHMETENNVGSKYSEEFQDNDGIWENAEADDQIYHKYIECVSRTSHDLSENVRMTLMTLVTHSVPHGHESCPGIVLKNYVRRMNMRRKRWWFLL